MADTSKVLEVLREAREAIALPGRWWSPGAFGRGEAERGARCALTAFGCLLDDTRFRAAECVANVMGVEPASIPDFNDSHTHAEVLAAFDRAIAILEAELEPTPNADAMLAVMAACDEAGAVIANQACAQHPELDPTQARSFASTELLYAAHDAATALAHHATAGAWS